MGGSSHGNGIGVPMAGSFIAIEGLDGCGSTTQVHLLAERLPNVHITAEPSDGPIGKLIRATLRDETPLSDAVFPYLFAADRFDHLEREIEPLVAEGKMVVSDRYYASSMAYQSLAAPLDLVMNLNAAFRPADVTVFLEMSPELALARIDARGEAKERFEEIGRLRSISEAYLRAIEILEQRGERVVRVDANGTPDEVHARIVEALTPWRQ